MYRYSAQRRWGAFVLLIIFCGAFGHAAVPHTIQPIGNAATVVSDCDHSHSHNDAISHGDDCTLCRAFVGLTIAAPIAVGIAQFEAACISHENSHAAASPFAVDPIRGPPRA